MDLVLLGTGAADGWPNPFCRCPSCVDAAQRGEIRGQTAALVDGALMIDCGPEAPGAAVRHGHTLADVRHLLVTHGHSDHLAPQFLLSRSWVAEPANATHLAHPADSANAETSAAAATATTATTGFEVIGPADALDQCRPWVAPDSEVRFRPVVAGDRLAVGDYEVRVLPAKHMVFTDGDAVLYDVTGPGGTRILWACDTGPWPQGWFDAVRDARFDAVFLEETLGDREEISPWHLGLNRFGQMLAGLREVRAVVDTTEVVAIHLGHHNPPVRELDERLRGHGARAGHDGQVLRLHGPASPFNRQPAGGSVA